MQSRLEAVRPGGEIKVDFSSVTIVQRTKELGVNELATLAKPAGIDSVPIIFRSGRHKINFLVPGGSGKAQIHEIPIGKGNIGIVFPGSPEIGTLLKAEPEQRKANIARAQVKALEEETDKKIFKAVAPNYRAMTARRSGDMAEDEKFETERDELLRQATNANYGAMAARRRAEAAEANVRSILGITQEPDLI